MKKNRFFVVLILCFSVKAYSQEKQPDLRAQLQDAIYVMNRFDEIATGLDVEIKGWKVDDSSKNLFRGELSATLSNANIEKSRLGNLLGKADISSTDLFDVYSELQSVAGELQAQASNAANWGDSETRSVELARLGAKALTLGAQIGLALRSRIALQEVELAACTKKPVAKTR
jgi:hypothetical protein